MAANDDIEKIKKLTEMQQSEANLHWQRNGFFLLSSSILLLALGQLKEMPYIQISFGILGFTLNIAWLLIQWRSSEYIKNWKNQVKDINKKNNWAEIYSSKVSGFEMRKIAMILPLPFLLIWIVVIIQNITIHMEEIIEAIT